MKEKIELSISNHQYYGKDNSDILKYQGIGTIYQKRNKFYIIYEDENQNGAITQLKIEPEDEKITINRAEPELKQIFENREKTSGKYTTPYGIFKLGVFTSMIDIQLDGLAGRFEVNYELYLNGQYTSHNYLDVSWEIL